MIYMYWVYLYLYTYGCICMRIEKLPAPTPPTRIRTLEAATPVCKAMFSGQKQNRRTFSRKRQINDVQYAFLRTGQLNQTVGPCGFNSVQLLPNTFTFISLILLDFLFLLVHPPSSAGNLCGQGVFCNSCRYKFQILASNSAHISYFKYQ